MDIDRQQADLIDQYVKQVSSLNGSGLSICKKGFVCGRALGGHMRAHGIGDDSGLMEDDEDEDQASDWNDKIAGTSNVPSSSTNGANKQMYSLRTNPHRVKTCRACQNCGKEFSSWKSFLEHGKCGGADSDEERSPISSPESNSEDHGWSRRKSSLKSSFGNFNDPSREDEDLAHCLMMLSNANTEYSQRHHQNQHQHQVEPDHESCASANRDDHFNNLMIGNQISADIKAKSVAKGLFECKACKKVFNSHQALGGHRASHKKVKGCFAARLDESNHNPLFDGETITNHKDDHFTVTASKSTSYVTATTQHHFSSTPSSSKRKSKVHECSVCHRVFSSGQALGGHKRCHWITSSNLGQNPTFPHFEQFTANAAKLDLNFPAFNNQQQRTALSFEISAENYFLQNNELKYNDEVTNTNNNNISTKNNNVVEQEDVENEDDANSKTKLAKLCDLNDVKEGGGEGSCSSWLQVGLGSTTTDNVVVVGDENIG